MAACGGYDIVGGYDGPVSASGSLDFDFDFDSFSSGSRSRFQSSSSEPTAAGTLYATTPGVPAAFETISRLRRSQRKETHEKFCMMGLMLDGVSTTGSIDLQIATPIMGLLAPHTFHDGSHGDHDLVVCRVSGIL